MGLKTVEVTLTEGRSIIKRGYTEKFHFVLEFAWRSTRVEQFAMIYTWKKKGFVPFFFAHKISPLLFLIERGEWKKVSGYYCPFLLGKKPTTNNSNHNLERKTSGHWEFMFFPMCISSAVCIWNMHENLNLYVVYFHANVYMHILMLVLFHSKVDRDMNIIEQV